MQVQNVSFKGYKNVIASNVRFLNADASLISMQLTNKGYCNDLDKWKAIQSKLFSNREPKDIFTFLQIKERDGDGFKLYLNDRELAPAKDYFLVSREEEKPMIKSFILLKSIAERIMGGEKSEWHFPEITNEMIPHNVAVLRRVLEEPNSGATVLADAVLPVKDKNENVASIFYNSIDDYMDGYVDHLERTGM